MLTVKKFVIKAIPNIFWDYYRLFQYKRSKSFKIRKDNIAETFDEIYQNNYWNSSDSYSGTGSDLKQTEVVRNALPLLASKYNIKSMLDVPCGDFNWMKLVDLGVIKYVGADIVADLIITNSKNYSCNLIQFQKLNLLEDDVPQVDLIFCRDCLVHFSYEHVNRALQNIVRSRSKFLLTTSFTKRRLNFDIDTGDWRPINLEIKPFNFPKPLETILEKCTEGNGKSYDKSLLLYRIDDLKPLIYFNR